MYRTQKMFQNFPLCAIWTKHFSGSAYKHSTNLSRNLLVFSPFLISVRRPGAPAPSQRLLAHHQVPARLEVQPHGVLHLGRHRCNGFFFSPTFGKRFLFLSFFKKIVVSDGLGLRRRLARPLLAVNVLAGRNRWDTGKWTSETC